MYNSSANTHEFENFLIEYQSLPDETLSDEIGKLLKKYNLDPLGVIGFLAEKDCYVEFEKFRGCTR